LDEEKSKHAGSAELHQCLLVCDSADENWTKKSQNILVWLSKMVLAKHFSHSLVCQVLLKYTTP
jgi:hypothetical protein